MYVIMSPVKWQSVLVCVHDIVVLPRNAKNLMTSLREVMTLPQDIRFILKLKKCSFFARDISHFGHIIRSGRLKRSKETATVARERKDPTHQTELRAFFRPLNVYRCLIPNFSTVAVPLNKMSWKDPPTSFCFLTQAERDAVENLLALLTNPPTLTTLLAIGQYTIDTDAWDSHVGCLLLQEQRDKSEWPIEYRSCTLIGAKQKLATTRKVLAGCSMGRIVTTTILETQRLSFTHEERGIKTVICVHWYLGKANKMGITTTPVQSWGSPPHRPQTPSAQQTIQALIKTH